MSIRTHRPCSVPGCAGVVLARGWCSKHWQRWWKTGDPNTEPYRRALRDPPPYGRTRRCKPSDEAADAALAEQLRAQFHYDPTTGVFTRLARTSSRVKVGQLAGTVANDYVYFCFLGRRQSAHRMAWLYVYGRMPVGEVDHRDGNTQNNAIANLRDEATVVNQHNQVRAHRQSKTGLLGAMPSKQRGGYVATISVDGKSRYLGHFETAEAAHAAYVDAKRRYHEGSTL